MFGYDAAIDYKAPDFKERLADAVGDGGVDVYFDNTAGAISDAVLARLSVGARIVICGTASVSSWDPPPMGPRVERQILVKRAHHVRPARSSIMRTATRRRSPGSPPGFAHGKLAYREDVLEGIEACPDAIASLYRGDNSGKLLVRLTHG